MENISEYILRPREHRRTHLDLSTPCDQRGGSSKEFRGLLAHFLNTTMPSGRQAFLCHACNNGSCSNVRHLYWGTPKDNHIDQVENGTFKNLFARNVEKHGIEKIREVGRRNGLLRKGKPGRKYTPEQIEKYRTQISTFEQRWGWIGKCADSLGISHTQLRRFLNAHATDLVASKQCSV